MMKTCLAGTAGHRRACWLGDHPFVLPCAQEIANHPIQILRHCFDVRVREPARVNVPEFRVARAVSLECFSKAPLCMQSISQ